MKLSDRLVLDARVTGEIASRSIAGQIEFWASLGRSLEPVLRGEVALALKKSGEVRPLSECIESVNTASGRARLSVALAERPFPHFEAASKRGLFVKIDENGKRTLGRFVEGEFRAVKAVKAR